MQELIFLPLIITAIALLFIAILILFKARKESGDKIFIVLNIVLFCWVAADIFYFKTAGAVYIWAQLTYLAAGFLPVIYLLFCREFLTPWKNIWAKITIFLLPVATMAAMFFWPNLMVSGNFPHLVFGPIYFIYSLYMVGYFGASYVILARKMTVFKGVQNMQLKFIFFGSFLSSVAAVLGALVFPLAGNYALYFVSPAFIIILSVFIAYAVFRHNLFNLKVITTELFAGILLIIFLLRLRSNLTPQLCCGWASPMENKKLTPCYD